ncbi:undecaprenyldiphospho-muramoylpentapeptide beta-N-acetylglucosaminyltransferase [Pleomorphomonas carboxyditropha]|uniref:UDP-N-acetylglucosamine--N-acetylmuramyl-(pentapeptide) pyrophosphoryl-undecaprenol N-acetylglucosamine transferase n=1 Tax=Pleomorphomonas carboxyditropha TaxID=2023338 RepID=A0A2G9X0S6_9HYPH|nr:undecaprenyldiphospho-muramoylpentapeptide beta-N-acetylglucosaminyltransferase [Pleomorphomonas carboxyditropha]PIP00567.1 undecaprenyldiphospho-muramoylpentapeptide beta-N-acetylglucosaminyltransferase [Pleomorphomonas carboxyditropha]
MTRTILIAAGGTGGHLFPAESLAYALAPRGFEVHLATDHRANTYGSEFPAKEIHIIASATFGDRSPLGLMKSATNLACGEAQSLSLVRRLDPAVTVGFGGYPTLPPLVAAWLTRRPTIVHESNAVMGRANRFLASRVTAIATTFRDTGLMGAGAARTVVTGNPVRPKVLAAVAPYREPTADGKIDLLVFGGSQGARVFGELVPRTIEKLPAEVAARLRLVQQVRPEDIDRVAAIYARLGIDHEIAPFFADLPARIANAHLVICRSGASSVAELTVIGRPSILVPLPHALDNDQKTNALGLEKAGGAVMAEQASLTSDRLADLIAGLVRAPERLSAMAAAAKSEGRPDAVERLADLVAFIASGGKPADFASKEIRP